MPSKSRIVIGLRRAATLSTISALLAWSGEPVPAAPRPVPELVVRYGNSSTISALALDARGRLLASASDDGLFVWDLAGGHMLRRLSVRGTRTAGFSRDGAYVLDGLHLYELRTGRVAGAVDAASACLGSFARSADGRWLSAVTQGGDRSLRATIWDLRAPGVAKRSFALRPPGRLRDANTDPCPTAFSPDGKRFYSDRPIVERDTATGAVLRTIAGGYDDVLGYAPDGRSVLTGSSTSRTAMFPLDLRALRDGHVVRSWGREAEVTEAAFSLDGKFFAVNSFGRVSVKELATGKERDFQYSGARFSAVALDRSGTNLLAGSLRGDLTVFDLARVSPRELWHGRAVTGATLSPNRQWLITVHEDHTNAWKLTNGRQTLVDLAEGYSIVWDLSSGQPASTVPKACEAVAFSSDSRRFACWSKNVVDVLDTASLAQVREFSLAAVRDSLGAIFFPNQPGKHAFFLAGDDVLAVYQDGPSGSDAPAVAALNLHSGEVDGPLARDAARAALAPSANGNAIAWIDAGGVVREYDPVSRATRALGQVPASPAPSPGETRGVLPSFAGVAPGGRYALGAIGTTVTVYDLAAGAKPAGEIAFGKTSAPAEFRGFSVDGALAAFAVPSGADAESSTLELLALPSGRVVARFKGRTAALQDFTLSQDRTLLIATASDATVQFWDVHRARQTGTLFAGSSDASTWLVSAPNGSFDSSPSAWSAMLWRFNGDTFDVAPPETFFNDFYDPGLLADLVAGRAPPSRTIASLDRRPARIDGLTIAGAAPYGRRIRVRLTVRNGGAGARDVRLARNGTLVKLWRGDVLQGRSAATLETPVTLVGGPNALTAYAFNRDGVRSPIEQLAVSAPRVPVRRGNAYVLTIGLNAYTNETFRLHYARADAAAFDTELRAQSAKLESYAAIRPISLGDARATKQNILAAVARIAKSAQPEDAVFIFFAGHGMADEGRFYLLPYDLGYRGSRESVTPAGVAELAAHGVSDDGLARALERVDARDIVLVIDACQSGQALGDDKRIGPLNAKGLAQLAYDKGIYVLAAAQSYQAALEAPYYGHGLLTYALVVDALHERGGAPSGGTGDLLVQPWFAFAQQRVPELQQKLILEGSAKGISVGFAAGEARATSPLDRRLQRPRIYFPRSAAGRALAVARFP